MTPEQATHAWIATMGPAAIARSNAYFEGGYWLTLAGLAATIAVSAILIGQGVLPRVRDALEPRIKNGFIRAAALAGVYLVISAALTFPLDVYQGYFREVQFGLATQTFPAWLAEFAIAFAINLVIGALAIAGLYMIVKRARKTWWLWGAVATGALMVVLVALAPVYIAPLFNTYKPMAESPLKRDILAMADANGVPATDVYVYDASRQSNRVTANVSGMFGTTRISLADNLLKRVSPEGVRMVMAHEIGHYVLRHTISLLFMTLATVAMVFALLRVVLERLIGSGRWRVRDVADPAGLPVVIAVAATLFTLATPLTNSITRFHERQADLFGINAARAPDGFAETALMLSEYRKMEPGAVEGAVFYDHPSGYDRILMAMRWKSAEIAAGRLSPSPLGPPPGYKPDFIVTRRQATR